MIYTGENLKEIVFPLGGIGSGSIGLSGSGNLVDWEIFNRPDKGSINGYSQISVRAVKKDGSYIAKSLTGDVQKDLTGQYSKCKFSGYGFGPFVNKMAGFSHFEDCSFDGQFPISKMHFASKDFPGNVILTAFNPFIPLDDKNSSIPGAFFEIEFENNSDEELEFSTGFSLQNPFDHSKNKDVSAEGIAAVMLLADTIDENDIHYGDLTLTCDAAKSYVQPYWYRGSWQDGIVSFWNEFNTNGYLSNRTYEESGKKDHCAIQGCICVKPGERGKIRYTLTWNVPNCYNYWDPCKDAGGKDVSWKNYYAVLFENSKASAFYSMKNFDSLLERTNRFKTALHSSTLDECVIDAVSSTMSVLKTATVLRLEDGSLYGWEGCMEVEGSCEGTCQHVWNYAYALCFLFPQLERSIRNYEYRYQILPSGASVFRTALPLGRKDYDRFRPCLDGQMGTVIKTYREWKISGDNKWLQSVWSKVKLLLEYAWSEGNEDEWDRNCDGVLEGRQHHTLDMELFGPSSWLEGFYLAALKAGAEMAEVMGEPNTAQKYRVVYEKGAAWTKENLFNGKYFVQKINLSNKEITEHFSCSDKYWNEETGEIKYQIGEGSAIDQLCGQWHAFLCGLGYIFDKQQIDTALSAMFDNNYKKSMRDFNNPWRIFALNDESGSIICDYPEGAYKPKIPISYCEESMHGFEYQFAALLAYAGKIKESITVVKAIRDRYNGANRNPWNEIECGSNYARSMASFSLLNAYAGMEFDMTRGYIGFSPKISAEEFRVFFSLNTAWGSYIRSEKKHAIFIEEGELILNTVKIGSVSEISKVYVDGKNLDFTCENGIIHMNKTTIKKELIIYGA